MSVFHILLVSGGREGLTKLTLSYSVMHARQFLSLNHCKSDKIP
jgi:hypothetical protein